MKDSTSVRKCACASLAILTFFFCQVLLAKAPMSDAEYQQALDNQTKYHGLLREADCSERAGDYERAVFSHEEAFRMARGSNLEPVSRGELARSYELNGEYKKALENINWFLEKSNSSSPLWSSFLASQQRLIQKIEAQKRGEKIEESKLASTDPKGHVVRNISDFQKADYGTQRQFMEKQLPQDTEIRRLVKQSMMDEHAGKFREARESYEQLLVRKDETVAIVGESGWVMLHPAVQRTSELIGDEAREKEMLVWIRDYMMLERAPYHEEYLNGLMPDVQDHLKKRLAKYGLP